MKCYRITACYFVLFFLVIPAIGFAQCSNQADSTLNFYPDFKLEEQLNAYDRPARFSILRGRVAFGNLVACLEEDTCIQFVNEEIIGVVNKWWLVKFRSNNQIQQGWILAAVQRDTASTSGQFEDNVRRAE